MADRPDKDSLQDWVSRAADDALRHAEADPSPDGLVTVASGISPSGHIHLGNLREFITPHFVAEDLRRRGHRVRHLHSWDDFDRFRKVPVGVDPSWAEHIGKPLTAVPDPDGEFPNWAERFKAPLVQALADMGCEMDEISQTEMYRSGAYRDQILLAVRHRGRIEEVLAAHRTKAAAAQDDEEFADSVAHDDETGSGDLGRFPYKPYCTRCGRDTVTLTSYDDDTTELTYVCDRCDHHGSTNLSTDSDGKLVWKVDWPMRWAYERVNFEPAGQDHMNPGSSYTVGTELVRDIFGWRPPARVIYGFVGFAGVQKMSSSAGGAPTPADALRVLEAPMVRWLYVRRAPKQVFDIDFGPQVVRLYDEWDALGRKAADPAKADVATLAFERASSTSTSGPLPTPEVVVPFRVLSSVADVTAGSAEQISRIVTNTGHPHEDVDQLQPRLARAINWTSEYVPADERTTVRDQPDEAALAGLSEQERTWIRLLLEGLPEGVEPEVETVTSLVYGVPKMALGRPLDAAPDDAVKSAQREFFTLLYHLLVDAERGPRLPTLIVALGTDRVRRLLTLPA